ncbi:MAG TPA: N-acetyltransferase [Candidatus Avacidaminococcus intestinavium]|uniref:N-acetyltransferase n=1 Tax=Candidatus Avacidaminococcus intestinavium TaxID=2840684 RepID=A0A9D1MPM2_9FIRM|nr:N-acetyltransferase [Candidatus Avacidaminococcus intestinavium]
MIREMQENEIKTLSALWLNASLKAHAFIKADFWRKNQSLIETKYLPQSLTYVYTEHNCLKGFLSLSDHKEVAGLFVATSFQGQGIGSALMNFVQKRYPSLTLDVYAKNENAVRFYQKHNFRPIKTYIGDDTGAESIKMRWQKQCI